MTCIRDLTGLPSTDFPVGPELQASLQIFHFTGTDYFRTLKERKQQEQEQGWKVRHLLTIGAGCPIYRLAGYQLPRSFSRVDTAMTTLERSAAEKSEQL